MYSERHNLQFFQATSVVRHSSIIAQPLSESGLQFGRGGGDGN